MTGSSSAASSRQNSGEGGLPPPRVWAVAAKALADAANEAPRTALADRVLTPPGEASGRLIAVARPSHRRSAVP
ncbi:hypothetical protein [Microbacterium sp. 10M-3C3]|uniref:hypothetical protein n=1 Tax=Microbacterium sp. 10M-3C3 TaxID=2483401 RepID=UPI000F62C7FF|nr:hypothetical protein [Microbacterium sp. 10M-3C3]